MWGVSDLPGTKNKKNASLGEMHVLEKAVFSFTPDEKKNTVGSTARKLEIKTSFSHGTTNAILKEKKTVGSTVGKLETFFFSRSTTNAIPKHKKIVKSS